MRCFIPMVLMVLAATLSAMPITPSAPELQRLAEVMRSTGMDEHDITKQLSLPADKFEVEFQPEFRPFLLPMSTNLHTLFHTQSEEEKSGDIAPGSLEAPQMLPRAAAPESFGDRFLQTISAILRRGDVEKRRFAYEGKEGEMRRPEGMRHWDS